MQGELRFDHTEIPVLHFKLLSLLLVQVPCLCGKYPLFVAVVTSSAPSTAACLKGVGVM